MVDLNSWHAEISVVCPIESLQILEGGDLQIVFKDGSTDEQRTAAVKRLVELQNTPLPQWEEFYQENLTLLFELLDRASNAVAANAVMIEFGKRPAIDLDSLKKYWNLSIGLLSFKPSQLTALKAAIEKHHLPIRLNDAGRWL